MTKLFVLIFWLNLFFISANAQENKIYTSLEDAAKVHPDSVYRLDLSKNRLTEIPQVVFDFKNLISLDLSKNKLTNLPSNFIFKHLEVLNLTKNKFTLFPEAICKNTALKQLLLGKNYLSELPECIGDLSELVILDAWFNTITVIPESIVKLKKLRSIDFRGMNYSDEFQQKWRDLLPWVNIEFDLGCDCGF